MKDSELFTFLAVTFNQEEFVIENLESIKYQIVNYGQGRKFQLIVADDSSKDNTINLIRSWTSKNKDLFEYIDILESEKNQGTAKNYLKGFRKIKGERFKFIGGDDIFSRENIFEASDLLDEYDVVLSVIAPFNEEGLYNDRKIKMNIYTMHKYAETEYSKLAQRGDQFPLTPGVFTRKELYTEDVFSFIDKVKLVEDKPMAIKVFESRDNLKIACHDKVTLLYRYHDKAVTKTRNTKVANAYLNDLDQLDKYIIKTSKSNRVRLKARYQIQNRKIKNPRLATLVNPYVLSYQAGYFLRYPKNKDKMNKIIEESLLPNEEHLKFIKREASKYYE